MTSIELLEIESIVRKVAAELYVAIVDTLPTPGYAMFSDNGLQGYKALQKENLERLLTRRGGLKLK